MLTLNLVRFEKNKRKKLLKNLKTPGNINASLKLNLVRHIFSFCLTNADLYCKNSFFFLNAEKGTG